MVRINSYIARLHLLRLYTSIALNTAQATPGLVLPEETSGLGCIPEGRTVRYQCTVRDPTNPPIGSTIWIGSAFNCSSSYTPGISLLHSQFGSGVSSWCGDLIAMSVGVNGMEYTSSLTLNATTELNEKMINCTFSSIVLIGYEIIKIGGWYSVMANTGCTLDY